MDPHELTNTVTTVTNIIVPPEGAEPISEADLQEQVCTALEGSPVWAHLSTFDRIFLTLSCRLWGAIAYQEAYRTALQHLSAEDSPELEYLCTAVAWIRTSYDDIDENMQKRLRLTSDDDVGQPVRVLKLAGFSGIPTR